MAGETISVVLADDHEVVRSGLRMLLESEGGIEVVAEAGDVDSARRYVLGHKPEVLVLDLNMAEGSSLPAIPGMLESSPGTAIARRRASTPPPATIEPVQRKPAR